MGWNECRGIGRFGDEGSEESFDGGIAWREVRDVWRQEAQKHSKLDLIGRLMDKKCEGCGIYDGER